MKHLTALGRLPLACSRCLPTQQCMQDELQCLPIDVFELLGDQLRQGALKATEVMADGALQLEPNNAMNMFIEYAPFTSSPHYSGEFIQTCIKHSVSLLLMDDSQAQSSSLLPLCCPQTPATLPHCYA